MGQTSEFTQIILAVVPILVSAAVTIITYKGTQEVKELLSQAEKRIAVLEQILKDNGIPVPAANGRSKP